MEINPGYKLSEVGVIPEEWEIISLGRLSAFITSGSRGWARYYSDDGALFIRSQNVRDGRLDFTESQFVNSPQGSEGSRTRVNRNDLLITITGNGVGNVALVELELGEAYISQHVGLVRLLTPSSGQYVNRFLSPGSPGNGQIWASQSGQSKPGLTLKNLQDFWVALPPFPEQRAIVTALSDGDALVESLEQLILKKRNIKQGAMQDLLTGKTRLPGFKEKWETHSVSEYFELVSTRNAELNDNVVTISAQLGFVRQEEFFKKRVASKVLENYYLIERGDFAYNRSYSNGYPFGAIKRLTKYAKGVVTTLYICFALKPNADADPCFFEHYFEAGLLNSGLATVTNEGGRAHGLLNITKADFFSRELNCPSGTEQTAIAAILSDMDAEIAALEAKLGKARHLKQGMMQELLTGKVRLV
jgi:type I restriction enzyme S subunit